MLYSAESHIFSVLCFVFFIFWSHFNKTLWCPGKQITLILVSRATAQTAQCPPLQNPAPLVAAAPHRTPRPTLAPTFLTPPSSVARIPLWVRTRRKRRTAPRRSETPSSVRPRPGATRPNRSWSPRRAITAPTPPVPWRRWPLRRPWPAAWDAQTPSARPARARGPAGRSPTDTFGSAWHRRCRPPAATHSATQRRTTGARRSTRGNPGGVSEDTCVRSQGHSDSPSTSAWTHQHVWLHPDQNTERTVLSDTVVANSHRTLRTNKVYFLTGTWGQTVIIAVREQRRKSADGSSLVAWVFSSLRMFLSGLLLLLTVFICGVCEYVTTFY